MIKKVAFDMDGVLCDFLAKAIEVGMYDPETGAFDKEAMLEANEHFWENLNPIVEGIWLYSRIYAFAKKYDLRVYILSHTVSDASRLGKKIWLEKNLSVNPMDIVFVSRRSDKNDFADSDTLLIDDYVKNVEDFRKAGGNAVVFHRRSIKDTLEEIRGFLNELV